MDLQQLEEKLAALGEPSFRAHQVLRWVARGAHGYAEMSDVPAALRERLEAELPFSTLALQEQSQARDGTVKALFATVDGRPLEAVLMRYRDGRRSLCLSSQSGCPLTCSFCATGSMRFARNLTTSEILDQALHFRRMADGADGTAAGRTAAAGAPLSHCVFMGMGEPMLNLDAVLGACEHLPELGIAHRRTTISTVGWIPGIERLAECPHPVRLALSLHAAEEALRSELMPVNERYPLAAVVAACRAFAERKRRRVFIEYVMLAGVNDRYEQALALARLLAQPGGGAARLRAFKVNLIPYNPTGSHYRGSTREAIAAFRSALQEHGVDVTVRLTRGRDIAAACGQLAAGAPPAGQAAEGPPSAAAPVQARLTGG
jgi:23S rRNA (adenine2503-C2)-methyltransferase